MISQNIKEIIAEKTPAEALEAIGQELEKEMPGETRSLLLAEKGKLLWRLGRRGEAMSAYEEGARLDPSGPAALLMEHSNSIMEFFNPDLLNP